MPLPRALVAPPYTAGEQDERRVRRQWALWDFVEGAYLWQMWWRQSVNEVRRRYKRTLLGPAWVTVSLLVFTVALSVIWAGLFGMNVREYLPFFLSGMLAWTMVSACIGEGCTVLIAAEGLVKSRQFPYTALIYQVGARNLVIFGHNLVGYVIAAAICGVAPSWHMILVLPSLVLLLLNAIWMALMVAVFCLRFRDFQQLVASFLQIATFITPIFWNPSQIQGKRALIVHMNPLHHMVDIVRQPLLGHLPSLESYAVCLLTALVGWFFAFRLFAGKRHRLAYWY